MSTLSGHISAAPYFEELSLNGWEGRHETTQWTFLMHVYTERAIFQKEYPRAPPNEFMMNSKNTHSPMKSLLSVRLKLETGNVHSRIQEPMAHRPNPAHCLFF